MSLSLDDGRPIFIQIAAYLEDAIINGDFKEGAAVPSTNQFAAYFNINPATAAKGINLLVQEGILYKKRGLGMFIAPGAKRQLIKKHKKEFEEVFILPMLKEAHKLNISKQEMEKMIDKLDNQSRHDEGMGSVKNNARGNKI